MDSHIAGGSVSDEDISNRNTLLRSSHPLNQENPLSEATLALELGEKLGLVINGYRNSVIEKLIELDEADKDRWVNLNKEQDVNA